MKKLAIFLLGFALIAIAPLGRIESFAQSRSPSRTKKQSLMPTSIFSVAR
jgi:hypothetical protein